MPQICPRSVTILTRCTLSLTWLCWPHLSTGAAGSPWPRSLIWGTTPGPHPTAPGGVRSPSPWMWSLTSSGRTRSMCTSMMSSILWEGVLWACQVCWDFSQNFVWSYKIVSLPGGFTKSGNPVLIFSDKAGFSSVSEGDLLILLKYFISVVPGREQVQ